MVDMERGRIVRPSVMTLEQMEADAKAAEETIKKQMEQEAKPAPEAEQKPEPEKKVEEPVKEEPKEEKPVVEPEQEKKTEPEPNAEAELLKAKLAEMEARNAELTKRVRDEDGRNGGKLAALQDQMTKLSDQLRQVMEENRELRKAKDAPPPVPAEPDPLDAEYPELAKGIERKSKPAMDAATKAEEIARETQERLARMEQAQRQREYDQFLGTIRAAVPKMSEYNSDPEFIEWCKGRNTGSPYARQLTLNACSETMNAEPVIELFQQWEKLKTAVKADETVASKAKPSKEAQLDVPKSGAPAPQPKTVNAAKLNQRLREIEDKVFRFANATAEDRLEYDKLLDAKERGEF